MLLRSVARLLPFALLLGACAQDEAPTAALPTAPDGGLFIPDAAILLPDGGQGDASAEAATEPLSGLLTLAEFRGTVTANGAMVLTKLDPAASSDPRLRRLAQGLCTLSIVQDGVAGSGPANSLELVTGTTGLDAACEGYLASPLFCGAVTVRSFYTSPQTQVFAQIQALVPSTGFGVQNGDVIPGASSGLGSWAYGDLGPASSAPANAGVRNWVFARSGSNFTFTGRVVANVTELCDGLDNDCDGATDEALGCRTQGQSCAATADCAADLACTAGLCSPGGCPSGEHVESGACASDMRACSITNGIGSQSYAAGSWAACAIVSCNSGYHMESGSCASDTRSCSSADATAATETWTGAEYGACTASGCLPTHHLEGGDCVSNTGACAVANGTGSRTYNAGAWGSCSLTGCNAGYHAQSGACELDTRSCTLADGAGSQTWLGSAWSSCAPSSCDTGYHVESGACASDARSCLLTGGAGDQTWNGSSWNSCVASACYGAFTLSNGTCVAAGCGNSVVEAGEACDDGNLVATDGCTASCAVAACGDGLVQAGVEGCDDGNVLTEECNYGAASCTICNATCVSAAGETDLCGDGTLDAAEFCDDGNTDNDDSCSNSCLCGAGYHVESGVCTSNARSCVAANATAAFESWTGGAYGACTATACDATYHVEAGACASDTLSCSVANATTATQSWTGSDYTACAATGCDAGYSLLAGACVAAGCGNSAVEAGEACDDGNLDATDACTTVCTIATCGDGVEQAGVDGCDDGNTVTEECAYGAASCAVCSATCTIAAGATHICGDGILDASEVCDDGNTDNEDSCSDACACGTGVHLEGGLCTSDTRSCLLANGEGTEQWTGNSYNGICTLESCNDGYHIAVDSCEADELSCTLANATAATRSWDSDTESYGSCTATACAASYHLESAACVANVRVCTLANGTATETWNSDTSSYGSCTPGICNSGYHVESGACLSNSRDCSLANASVATETWTGSAYGACTATTCASGYILSAGACGLQPIIGNSCTANAQCATGFCATGPAGTANDRCAPTGMNFIPAETFTMGSPATEVGRVADETQHSVTISRSFFMNLTEVTQGEWKALSGGLNPSWFQSTTVTTQSTANANNAGPAENMDWYAAVAFANARSAAEGLASCYTLAGCTDVANGWKDGIHSGCTGATFSGLTCTGYRLPTESEWEYAARAGTATATYGGNLSGTVTNCTTAQANLAGIAWWCINAGGRTQAVGGKTANSFGLYDMLGNLWEWTADWYGTYPGTVTDPLGATTGVYRVYRGGSWQYIATGEKAAFRAWGNGAPVNRFNTLGFRLSRTVARGCAALPANATAAIEAATATDWGACEATACSASYHLEGGACLSDTRNCSLPNATLATQAWNSATSAYGSCTVTTCATSYHLEGVACLSDTRSCSPLPANTTAGTQTWNSGTSAYGSCNATTCAATYHVEDGACLSDTLSCTPLPDNATASAQSWNSVTSSYGTCNATACDATYHVEGGACLSDTRSCSPLPANTTSGNQTWTGIAYGSCTATACASGYDVNLGVCSLGSSVGTSCTANAECASGVCATGPAGTENDRCAPTGMNYIPAGTFTMGSPSTEVGRAINETQHSVTLTRSFFMGQTEVTQGQWKAISGGTNSSCFQSTTGTACTTSNANNLGPAEYLDWYAALAFANAKSAAEGLTACYTLTGCTDAANGWKDGIHTGCTAASFAGLTCRGYRLPTESEWEYAARGGTTTATYLGNLSGTVTGCTTAQANLDGIAWWCKNAGSRTQAVGGKTANSFGLSDMLGNVWEWTGDWNGTYPGTVTDPLGVTTGTRRVARGGSYFYSASNARAAFRVDGAPGGRTGDVGLRLARTVTRGCAVLPANATTAVEAANSTGWGACEVTACAASYHLEGGACLSNTRTCSPMPANTTAATQTWNSATRAYGSCTATTCATSYHVEGGACLSDTRTCSPMPANTTAGTQTWTGSAYGSCTATTCASSYNVVAGACIGSLGAACTLSAQCASGFCATGPTGTANDRCAPTGMNYIPAGTFTMGSPSTERGRVADETQHSVTLSRSYFMNQTEVTQGQWKALSGGLNPSFFQSTLVRTQSTANANDSGPAEYMDWYAAAAFANARSAAEGLTACYALTGCTDAANGWKDGIHSGCSGATFSGLTCTGYRLPTESEWERAARAGTATATYLGNLSSTVTNCTRSQTYLDGIAWWCKTSGSRTQAVGLKAVNSFALSDMLGNVFEWTGDWYGTYPGTVTDPTGPSTGSERLRRGGAWLYSANQERAAFRSRGAPSNRVNTLGLRLARTVTRSCAALPANATAAVEAANATGWRSCEATACAASYHLEGGACLSDTRTCSPMPANTTAGTQSWNSATSAYGSCTATTCATSYHVEGGACLSDTRSCSLANATVATETWNSGTSVYGSCTATTCAATYHVEGGACLSNTRSCSTLPANTTAGTQTWTGSVYASCIASACASGYEVNVGVCSFGSFVGTSCTLNTECASGNCATGPTGTANDRCAPIGMNYIPAGTFTMGSPSTEVGRYTDETQHSVTISRRFFMGQTEVTQGQWKALSSGTNPSFFQSTTGTVQTTTNANDSGPVEYLDWYAALAFANAKSAAEGHASCYTLTGCTDAANGWRDGIHSGCTGATFAGLTCTGFRLPTESEWEYAARGGTTTATYLGNLSGATTDCTTAQANLESIDWWCINSGNRSRTVGGKTANSFGLFDMLGNVWEWTGDWYNVTYPGTVTDPLGASTGSARAFRGGSWSNPSRYARAGGRYSGAPTIRYGNLGLRLARTVP